MVQVRNEDNWIRATSRGTEIRKEISDVVKLKRNSGQIMHGQWGRGSIAPRPQAWVPGRDLMGASPPTVDLLTLHHNCLRPLRHLLVTWATAGPQRGHCELLVMPRSTVFPGESMRTIFRTPGLELWLSHKFDIWLWTNDSHYWASEPSTVRER